MSETFFQHTIGDKRLTINYESNAENPRSESCDEGIMSTLLCKEDSRYELGDKQYEWNGEDELEGVLTAIYAENYNGEGECDVIASGWVDGDTYDNRELEKDACDWHDDEFTDQGLQKFMKYFKANYIYILLEFRDYGGGNIKLNERKVGGNAMLYIKRSVATAMYAEADNLDNVVKYSLQGELQAYNDYLNGDVYWYEVETAKECKECNHVEWENPDGGTSGYYGDDGIHTIAEELDSNGHNELATAFRDEYSHLF